MISQYSADKTGMKIPEFDFAPLNIEIHQRLEIFKEIQALRNEMVGLYVGSLNIDKRLMYPRLAPDEKYMQVHVWDGQLNKCSLVPNGFHSWYGINFTSSTKISHAKDIPLRFRPQLKDAGFDWDPQYKIPCTRSLIEQLKPQEIIMCRAMWMEPGSFGPFHIDSGSLWHDGYMQFNFTIQSGGSPLMIQTKNGLIESFDDCIMFKDTQPHGVPVVQSTRLILVVVGKFDVDYILSILNYSKAQGF